MYINEMILEIRGPANTHCLVLFAAKLMAPNGVGTLIGNIQK